MISLKLVRELDVHAASGLVRMADDFYIVADDENYLLVLHENGKTSQIQLFPGELSEGPKERKKQKPDLEAIFMSKDSVIALPSSSTDQRFRGAAYNVRTRMVLTFNIEALAKELYRTFPELNIEGATLVGDELWLFQRGNGAIGASGLIVLDGTKFLHEMGQGQVTPASIKSIKQIDLGKEQGVTLGPTDACFANGVIYFLAVAEDSQSTYEDGNFVGAVLGKMDLKGNVLKTVPLSCDQKPEGLWIEGQRAWVVTDADDRQIFSRLYTADLEALS